MAKSLATLFLLIAIVPLVSSSHHDYGQALSKSILFFEAQRSGYLPGNQRVKWRGNSGLLDGKASGIDLVGGYYDAGDNVKFGLPMAFTVTMMSWSIIEYGSQMMSSGELGHAMDAVKWGTDYLIKAHPQPHVLYGEVGDGNTDHYCWQRPEDMTTSRSAYRIDENNPGSDLAGETAAAMAAASIVFHRSNPAYSRELLTHAHQLFDFADKYRGKYDSSISVAQKYYRSVSGYADELLWAAAWLYKATNEQYYLNYLGENGDNLGGTGWAMTEFGWDVKYAGVQTLVSMFLMGGKANEHAPVFGKYQDKAEMFMCSCMGKSYHNVQKTPGGLIYRQRWNNLQFVTSAAFLLTVYSDHLTSARKDLECPTGSVAPSELLAFAKSQVDYILGDNPRATSYMVGYGNHFPQQVHHRGSSIVSVKVNPSFVSCRGGYATWFSRKASDPNLLAGAIVGGPDAYDNFADQRDNYEQTEPATYNNAPLLGVLARLIGGHATHEQLLPVEVPLHKRTPVQPKPTPKARESPFSSPLEIDQKATTSWVSNGRTYYRYSAVASLISLSRLEASSYPMAMASSSTFLTAATKPFSSFTTHPSSVSTKSTSLGLGRNSFKVNAIATKYEPTKVKPQADRVLIRLEELPEKSAGGVLLPKSAVKFERYLMGEILSVGTEVGDLEAGKKVLFSDMNAYEVDLGASGRHVFCKAGDLLAVVE